MSRRRRPTTRPRPAETPAAGTGAAPAGGEAAAAGGECCKADDTTPPLDLVKNTPKGGLHNPYNDKIADADFAEEGHKTYLSAGCNGCHGGGGGGGMCPPLTNDTWVYGPDDDTLFRLGHARLRRPEGSRAITASSKRSWSDRCRPSAASSRPATSCGRSSPSSAR